MGDEISFIITYKNNTYKLDSGLQAYIFHAGVFNLVDKKYGMKALLKYVGFVQDLYLKDDNPTPLGNLCDYVAKKWRSIQKIGNRRDVLDKFYTEEVLP